MYGLLDGCLEHVKKENAYLSDYGINLLIESFMSRHFHIQLPIIW